MNGNSKIDKWKLFVGFLLITIFSSSCIYKEDIKFKISDKYLQAKKQFQVTNVQFVNNEFVLTGSNLEKITQVKIKDGLNIEELSLAAQSSNNLIARALANAVLPTGKVLELIVSNAHSSTTYSFNFSLCNSLLGGKGFDCNISPNDKEVLSYDATSGKWKPRAINGLSYKGAWDANDPFPEAGDSGEYYIVSHASGEYEVGDWIVFNGTTFNKIDNSQSIVSVFGKTGVVTADLNDLSDVNITSPTNGQVLKFNGGSWINDNSVETESDPTVLSFAKNALPSCGNNEVLKSNGTQFSCVPDNTGAGVFTGTADKIVVTNSSGNLASSNVDSTSLNNLIPWSSNGIQTIHPSRLNLGVSNANKAVVTDASGFLGAATISNTELSYLSGTSSNIQNQLNSKISTETDPNVSAFAKSALPNCDTNEVLKGNGSVLSCVNVNGYVDTQVTSLQNQINNKQSLGKIITDQQDAGTINPFGTSTGQTGEFRFYELVANGAQYTGFKAPDLLNTNIIYTLPQVAPTSGQVLSSTSGGVLSWVDSGSAPVTSVNAKTGIVTLTSSDINEGTNLYFTNSRALSTQITAPTLSNMAIATNDSIQVSLGKLQAQINNRENQITSSTSAYYFRGDKVWSSFASDALGVLLNGLNTAATTVITNTDSFLTAFGKLQGQLHNKADKTNLTQIISAQMVTGLQSPVANSDAANKSYVDSMAGAWTVGSGNAYRTTGRVGIGTSSPNYPLTVNGVIESTTGGIRFPDGSVQETAATSSTFWSPSSMSTNATFKSVASSPLGQLGTQLTTPTSGSVDDGFYTITLPFAINFNGVNYSTVYIGTNSYVTFGSGTNAYSGLSASNPSLNKILIAAADRSSNSIWFSSSPTSFSIRYEGGCGTSPSNNQIWEMRVDSSNTKKIILNVISLCAGGYSVIASTTASLFAISPTAASAYEIETLDNPITSNSIYYLGDGLGIGTSTIGAKTKLKVNGQIVGKSASIASSTIDFSQGNTISTSFDCNANLVLDSIRDGGDYKIIVTGGSTTQCNFDLATQGDDASNVTYRFSPANAARVNNSHTIYRLTRVGTIIYVSWTSGYQ